MSLLDNAMERCCYVNRNKVPDGYGGTTTQWRDGAEFQAAIVLDNSTEARVAQAQGVHDVYTVTTRKNTVLEYHDVIRRLSDNKIFRVTSDGDDKATPNTATLSMRQVSAEEWELPL